MHLKTAALLLVILDSSRTPPDLHKGPTGFIFQSISSDSPVVLVGPVFADEKELVVRSKGKIG